MTLLAIYMTGYTACCAWLLYQLFSLPEDEVGMDWTWLGIVAVLSLIWPLLLAFELYDAWR
mgnify:CR=1 FL=1